MTHRDRVLIINAIDSQMGRINEARTVATLAGGKDCDAVKGLWLLYDEYITALAAFKSGE